MESNPFLIYNCLLHMSMILAMLCRALTLATDIVSLPGMRYRFLNLSS